MKRVIKRQIKKIKLYCVNTLTALTAYGYTLHASCDGECWMWAAWFGAIAITASLVAIVMQEMEM